MKKNIYHFSIKDPEEVAKIFNSSLKSGLEEFSAKEKLLKDGPNEVLLKETKWWEILLNQFKSPFIYLLIFATFISFFLGEKIDAFLILIFITINTFLGFYQEFKSNEALKLLKEYTNPKTTVIRDGKEKIIPSRELVLGDIVVLDTGDLIPADIRIIEKNDILVDESVLTGESVAVHKNGRTLESKPKDIYEAKNLLFSGTTIASGITKGIVIATGKNTTFGKIKKLTTEVEKESPFAKGISRFSNFILKLIIVTLIFVFLANIAIKGKSANIGELFIFSVALAVSVIPEALPVVTTLSLSRGALRLAKKKVVVKRLSAVEDLGGIEVLCTDKTGTITQNKLKIKEILPSDGRKDLLIFANLAGEFTKENLDPFDIALKEALSEEEKNNLLKFEIISRCPFDPKRKRNSVLVKNKDGKKFLIVRGAPEEILKLSSNLNEKSKKIFKEWFLNEGNEGNRVLGIAIKEIQEEKKYYDVSLLEKDLNFEGCISFYDPIKETTFKTIKKAKKLGLQIKIITGDSKEVAFSVGQKIGLVKSEKETILASEFLKLNRSEQKRLISKIKIFARTDPEQKHKIIKILQENYEVGFLGEGINDAPAIKAAGVSLVVDSASDISRETADIILLEKDLSVIVDGIEEGRKIFANTVKYLKATLASNFGNFYAVAIGSLFINFLPMLPIQILLVNLLSDFPMISIATDSVDKIDTQKPQKYNVKDVVLIATLLGIVSTVFDFMFFGFFYKISPAVLQTNWFIGSILTELVFLFSIRTRLPFYKAEKPSKPIIGLSSLAFLTTIILPYTKIGQKIFRFTPPTRFHLFIILSLVFAYFFCSEIVKNIYYKIEPKKK